MFGTPGNQVYIRGQNDGPYNVPGVPGTFQNSPGGQHVFQDDQGNTYVHQRGGAGRQGTHSISGPGLTATRGQSLPPAPAGGPSYNARSRRGLVVTRPDRTVLAGPVGTYVGRSRRGVVVSRPDRVVIAGPGGAYVSRQSRAAPADFQLSIGPDNVVQYGRPRRSPQFHISRPDRTVDVGSDGSFIAQRHRRSPQRVQGDNFVARGNQAGTWNDEVSVWKRPDGRTVTIDKNGNAITSGSPNGRGPQYVSYRFQYYKT